MEGLGCHDKLALRGRACTLSYKINLEFKESKGG